jgi:hypothetical protein
LKFRGLLKSGRLRKVAGKGQPDNDGWHKDNVGRGGSGATGQIVKEKMVRQDKGGGVTKITQ